jgi:hypothetical protein
MNDIMNDIFFQSVIYTNCEKTQKPKKYPPRHTQKPAPLKTNRELKTQYSARTLCLSRNKKPETRPCVSGQHPIPS